MQIVDAEEGDGNDDDDSGFTSMNIKIKGFEQEKKITMNTAALENKINAL